MKKFMLLALTVFMFSGCGFVEAFYDNANYESITNERGDIYMISGGDTTAVYLDCKVKYADANSQAVWITDSEGEEHYVQGDLIFDMK
jgi:hypothetical protein